MTILTNPHAFMLLIAFLFGCSATRYAFEGAWPLVMYSVCAALLQVSVVWMGK